MKLNPKTIVKVTKTEFEMDDGVVYPIPFELENVPSVDEFQKIYDEWFRLFQQKELISSAVDE
ncbi:MAG TPA: hypothetical protein PLP33_14650 [Leptospiraceae bacterium]|nr:hypothetical protein [Leptospiraceae bacterium]